MSVSGLRAGGQLLVDYTVTSDGSSSGWQCTDLLVENPWAEVDPFVAGVDVPGYQLPDLSRHPVRRYLVQCSRGGDSFIEAGYIYPDQVLDVDLVVANRARSFYQERIGPTVSIGSSPPGGGLVGLDTWFWVDGYDAQPRQETFNVVGRGVVLTLQAQELRWDFGDGETAVLGAEVGFGQAGAPSSTAHRYNARSTDATAPERALTVSVELVIGVSYTLDGRGPFVVDPPLSSTAQAGIVVREAQAVIR